MTGEAKRLKEAGNGFFNENKYTEAIVQYKDAFNKEENEHSILLIQIINNLIFVYQKNKDLTHAVEYCNLLIASLLDLKKHVVAVPDELRHKSIFRLHAVATQLSVDSLESCLTLASDTHEFSNLFANLGFLREHDVKVKHSPGEGLYLVAGKKLRPNVIITLYAGKKVVGGELPTGEFLPNRKANRYLHECAHHFGCDVIGTGIPFSPEVAGALCNDGTLSCPEVLAAFMEMEQSLTKETVKNFLELYEDNKVNCNNAELSKAINFPTAGLCVVSSNEINKGDKITVAYGGRYWLNQTVYLLRATGKFSDSLKLHDSCSQLNIFPPNVHSQSFEYSNLEPVTERALLILVNEYFEIKLRDERENFLDNYFLMLLSSGINGFDGFEIKIDQDHIAEVIAKLDSIFDRKASFLLMQLFHGRDISVDTVLAILAALITQALPNEKAYPASCILKLVNAGVFEIVYNKHEKFTLTM